VVAAAVVMEVVVKVVQVEVVVKLVEVMGVLVELVGGGGVEMPDRPWELHI